MSRGEETRCLPAFSSDPCLGSSSIHMGTLLRLCYKPIGSGLLVLLHPDLLWDGTEDKALSLWSGSTDSKTLDYQRTNPREYQIVRTHTRKLTQRKLTQRMPRPGITQPPVAPRTDVSSEQQTKQKYKPNHQQTGLSTHSALAIRGKTNKQTKKNSA